MTDPVDDNGWTQFKHNGKSVGRLSRDGKTFHCTRVHSVHYARKYQGYGIQRTVLRGLVEKGVERIMLHVVKDDGNDRVTTTYRVDPHWWLAVGMVACLRYEDGAQVFLTERQLQRQLPLPARLTLNAPEPRLTTCIQCALNQCGAHRPV